MRGFLVVLVFWCACSSSPPRTSGPPDTGAPDAAIAATPKKKTVNPHPGIIVGKWRASGQLDPPDGMSWYAQYDFRKDGTFVMEGYPPISVTGKWEVIEQDRRKYRLLLTEQKMGTSTWPDKDEWIDLADESVMKWGDREYHPQR